MSLTVRVGDNLHLTREVSGLKFRKECVGGVRSIQFRLSRPLSSFDAAIAPFSPVSVIDGRTTEIIAQGRLSDTGRGAAIDGQTWDMVGFGPAQHATDIRKPYLVIDRSLDGWERDPRSTRIFDTKVETVDDSVQALTVQVDVGKPINTADWGGWIYRAMQQSGQVVARVSASLGVGGTSSDWDWYFQTRLNGGGYVLRLTGTWAPGTQGAQFASAGHNIVAVGTSRNTNATAGGSAWINFAGIIVRSRLMNADGTDITSGRYNLSYVYAHEIVNDLLGRALPQFDGANAVVDTGGTYQITQIAYPDGVAPEQVFTDLMQLEPGYRWTTGPNVTGDGYQFRWEPWPTTVRYEATLQDGGDFPVSTQDLYNRVTVRWRDANGRTRSTLRTMTCPELDRVGIVRHDTIDLADELGSSENAIRAGDNYLADHNVAKNAGTLTVSRPIRDLVTGRLVDPWEIEPGELVRVNGIESSPDAFNADSNDGQTVFRIWAVDYESDSNSSRLELDAYTRTEANAVAALAKRRLRKR